MVTIKDIAAKLGVSISTVSKGLHNASDISEDMRQQVLDTAIELGYTLKEPKNTEQKNSIRHKVCVIVENMEYANINQFGYELITGFRLMATEHQYEVDIIPMDSYIASKQSFDQKMRQDNYMGAFFLGFEMDNIYINELRNTTFPTVLFDNYIPNPNIAYVGSDYRTGIHELVTYLHQKGHQKIALLNGSRKSYISSMRSAEIINELKLLGISIEDSMIYHCTNFVPENAKEIIPSFVKSGATAIICASDLIAAVTINELNHLGLRVPQDISVTGFDDLPISKYLSPPLTTVRQERFLLGKTAFQVLLQLISGIQVSTTLLHSNLMIRESVADITKQD